MPEIKSVLAPNRYGPSFNDQRRELGLAGIPWNWSAAGKYAWESPKQAGHSPSAMWVKKYMVLDRWGNAVAEIDEIVMSGDEMARQLAVEYHFEGKVLSCIVRIMHGMEVIERQELDRCSCSQLVDSLKVDYHPSLLFARPCD
jgi:hypothetical protein